MANSPSTSVLARIGPVYTIGDLTRWLTPPVRTR